MYKKEKETIKPIGESVNSFLKSPKKRPTSERAYWIQKICDDMLSDSDFKKVMGQARELTVEELIEIHSRANPWLKNPGALFWKLLKEKKEVIKAIKQYPKKVTKKSEIKLTEKYLVIEESPHLYITVYNRLQDRVQLIREKSKNPLGKEATNELIRKGRIYSK